MITEGGSWLHVATKPKVGLGCTGKTSRWGLWWGHSQVSPPSPPAPHKGIVAIAPEHAWGLGSLVWVQWPPAESPSSFSSAFVPHLALMLIKKSAISVQKPQPEGCARLSSPATARTTFAVEGIGEPPWEGVPLQHLVWGLPAASQDPSGPPSPQRMFLSTTLKTSPRDSQCSPGALQQPKAGACPSLTLLLLAGCKITLPTQNRTFPPSRWQGRAGIRVGRWS